MTCDRLATTINAELAEPAEKHVARRAAATSIGLSALAVAGPVREQPRPSHPTAHSPRGGDPGGARRKALVTADASAPGGAGPPTRQPRWGAEAAPFAATCERLM